MRLRFRQSSAWMGNDFSKGVSPVRLLSRTLLVLLTVAQFIALAIAFQKPAYAYADPGSGLLFLQVAGSMAAGALFIVRSKLRKLFRLGKNHVEEQPIEQQPEIQQ
jgi:hypothetical protein